MEARTEQAITVREGRREDIDKLVELTEKYLLEADQYQINIEKFKVGLSRVFDLIENGVLLRIIKKKL